MVTEGSPDNYVYELSWYDNHLCNIVAGCCGFDSFIGERGFPQKVITCIRAREDPAAQFAIAKRPWKNAGPEVSSLWEVVIAIGFP